jgi:hypothetical protein
VQLGGAAHPKEALCKEFLVIFIKFINKITLKLDLSGIFHVEKFDGFHAVDGAGGVVQSDHGRGQCVGLAWHDAGD